MVKADGVAQLVHKHLAAIVSLGRVDVVAIGRIHPDVAGRRAEAGVAGKLREGRGAGDTGGIVAEQDGGGVGIGPLADVAFADPDEFDVGHVGPGPDRQLGLVDLGRAESLEPSGIVGHRERGVGAIGVANREADAKGFRPAGRPADQLVGRLVDGQARLAVVGDPGALVGVEEGQGAAAVGGQGHFAGSGERHQGNSTGANPLSRLLDRMATVVLTQRRPAQDPQAVARRAREHGL